VIGKFMLWIDQLYRSNNVIFQCMTKWVFTEEIMTGNNKGHHLWVPRIVLNGQPLNMAYTQLLVLT
jgi:hypothetical protein